MIFLSLWRFEEFHSDLIFTYYLVGQSDGLREFLTNVNAKKQTSNVYVTILEQSNQFTSGVPNAQEKWRVMI